MSAENRGRMPTAGVGFLGGGSKPSSHQLGFSGSAVSSQAGFGAELRPPKGFLLFSALRIDSPDSIIVFIVHHKKKLKNSFPIQS